MLFIRISEENLTECILADQLHEAGDSEGIQLVVDIIQHENGFYATGIPDHLELSQLKRQHHAFLLTL